ncbi:uncharacterized protein LOC133850038 [Drosophila sulfurigaster albostrigata]|uniref:uncharacterized protein LOC133850038 n=1 Tax=Drosophila sulfurigaster albostrigata TaxID=89887 RepID=UPI002D2185C8|nr:uncharacterized protein LOC133850038 [Drosophila sulfurigaster albostrigata]
MTKTNKNYTIGANKWRLICLLSIAICILLYFKINSVLFDATRRDHFMEGYFLNTSGCHMLAMNPFSKTALSYFGQMEPLECTKFKLFDAKTINGRNYLVLSMSPKEILNACEVKRIADVHCEYRRVKRYDDNSNKYSHPTNFELTEELIEVKSGATVIRIQCFGIGNKTVYHDVHFFIPPPSEEPPQTFPKKRLSVMIIGIDSLSHLHFLRSMPLLDATIETLPHVEFWGYNRVGRNTYPNLVPLFSGLNDVELEEKCYIGKHDYDECDFIWKRFKAAGFNTSYAEDTFIGGTFNYGKWGFNKSPTDFYLRTAMLEIDKYCRYSIDKQEDIHCTGNRKYADILHEFLHKLLPHLKSGTHFSFFWQSQGVHDYYEYAQFLDKKYQHLIYILKSERILENTFVFLMSDHGLRYGSFRATYQGMLEESQPLLIAIYPKWFAKKFPLAAINLRRNAHRLVTTFDMHATLKDLTDLQQIRDVEIKSRAELLKIKAYKIPRGISLFLPIPKNRDCEMAGIPSAFCLCQSFKKMETKNEKSERAARFIVENINTWISGYTKCQTLHLSEVHEAYLLHNSNNLQTDFEVKIRVQTSPGKGNFEGIVRFMSDVLVLNGPVLRTNKYGNQSHCIHDYHVEMYCYCL